MGKRTNGRGDTGKIKEGWRREATIEAGVKERKERCGKGSVMSGGDIQHQRAVGYGWSLHGGRQVVEGGLQGKRRAGRGRERREEEGYDSGG